MKINVPETIKLDESGVVVPESAMKLLDELIHMLYGDSLWWKINPDSHIEDSMEFLDGIRAQKAKVVAKAFGLYPYNQDEVRNP